MIPAAVSDGLAGLQTAAQAAQPLDRAPASQIGSLMTTGVALLGTIDIALSATGKPLDVGDPSGHPLAMISAVQRLADAARDQSILADMRGYVGRAVLNISQVG